VYRYDKGITAMNFITIDDNLDKYFELIGIYCNGADYKKALEELEKIEPYCKTPAQKARYHYSRGYINYASISQLSALAEYRKGLREDPDDTMGLKKECAYSKKLIKREYAEMRKVVLRIVDFISEHYNSIPENDKIKVDDHAFQLLLGFYQSIRMPHIDDNYLGFPRNDIFLGFDDYFAKLTGEKQENAKTFLKDGYDIIDRESYFECIRNNQNLDMNGYISEVMAYLNDKSSVDVNQLDGDEKLYFLAKVEFVQTFFDYLPDAGVIAWDLSAQIALTRIAFACDIINKEDYCHNMSALTDVLKGRLSSFEEYARSFIFGSAILMFKVKSMNITKSTDFMFSIMGYLDMGNLLDTKWIQ
ncbi:MAG: DUF1266 domain-containing protein, partial [Lachnospiraceae bacterium]|nr:DUF1266 domain-containing protein [Lachnospiraceae bacterium]